MKKKIVLDLFCGCGGLSYGFSQAGYDIRYGIDHCCNALKTYQYNHPNAKTILADLELESVSQIIKSNKISKIDIIIGGPPCQGYSLAGKRNINDERNLLYKSFLKFVDQLKPATFLIENVPNILSIGNGTVKQNIIKDFLEIGYFVSHKTLLASDFGVPQNRKRAFFIGFNKAVNFEFPTKNNQDKITTREAISDLPEFSIEDGSKYLRDAESKYQLMMRNNQKFLYNHQITNHQKKTVDIISLVPDGGNYKNLPEELQNTRNVNIAWTRLKSDQPSYTIDTGHRHHFHYQFNRVPTVRESARIQSFPDNFIFFGSKTSQYQQVGNAVPPLLSEALADQIKAYL